MTSAPHQPSASIAMCTTAKKTVLAKRATSVATVTARR